MTFSVKICISSLFLSILVILALCQSVEARKIYLIRHAEEPEHEVAGFNGYPYAKDDLDPVGYVRSLCLVHLFAKKSRVFPKPKRIICQTPKHSRRSVETVFPLSIALKIPIDTPGRKEDVKSLVKFLENLPNKADPILIAWWGRIMPNITHALGIKPPEWPHSWKGSNQVWILDTKHKRIEIEKMHCPAQTWLHENYCLRSVWQPGPAKPRQGKWPPYSSESSTQSSSNDSKNIQWNYILPAMLCSSILTALITHILSAKLPIHSPLQIE